MTGPKTARSIIAKATIALDLAKEVRSASTMGTNSTYTNRRSREDKRNNSMPSTEGRVCLMEPIYYGGR